MLIPRRKKTSITLICFLPWRVLRPIDVHTAYLLKFEVRYKPWWIGLRQRTNKVLGPSWISDCGMFIGRPRMWCRGLWTRFASITTQSKLVTLAVSNLQRLFLISKKYMETDPTASCLCAAQRKWTDAEHWIGNNIWLRLVCSITSACMWTTW